MCILERVMTEPVKHDPDDVPTAPELTEGGEAEPPAWGLRLLEQFTLLAEEVKDIRSSRTGYSPMARSVEDSMGGPPVTGGSTSWKGLGIKIPFPRTFSGEDPRDTVHDFEFRMNQYFQNMKVETDVMKVEVMSLCLEGVARQWYQGLVNGSLTGTVTLRDLGEGLKRIFGTEDRERRARMKMKKLIQAGRSVDRYISDFQKQYVILSHGATEVELLDCFVNGLDPSIKGCVEAHDPRSVTDAIELSRKWSTVGMGGSRMHVVEGEELPVWEVDSEAEQVYNAVFSRGGRGQVSGGRTSTSVGRTSDSGWAGAVESGVGNSGNIRYPHNVRNSRQLWDLIKRLSGQSQATWHQLLWILAGGEGEKPVPGTVLYDRYQQILSALKTSGPVSRVTSVVGRPVDIGQVGPVERRGGRRRNSRGLININLEGNALHTDRELVERGDGHPGPSVPPVLAQTLSSIAETSDTTEVKKQANSVVDINMTGNKGNTWNRPLMHVVGSLNGTPSIKFLVDTGAAANVLYLSTLKKVGGAVTVTQVRILRGIGDQDIKTMGQALLLVQLDGVEKKVLFDVIQGSGRPILGKPSLGEMEVLIDPARDQLIIKKTGQEIPCFAHKTRTVLTAQGEAKWTVTVANGGIWNPVPGRGSQVYEVCLNDTVVLLPGAKTVVDTGITMSLEDSLYSMVVPRHAHLLRQGVQVYPAMLGGQGLDVQEELLLVVENLLSKSIRIQKGLPVATCSVVKKTTVAMELQKNE